MTNIVPFNFKDNQKIRTIVKNDAPWFIAKDVATILEYSDTQAMTRRLDGDEFMTDKLSGMNMKSTIINESGLYTAIIGSSKPQAKEFKRWITHEVLPTIRKTGSYSVNPMGLVPVSSHTRRLPSGPRQITLSDKEHSAIGGIVKKCVTAAMRECLIPLLQQTPVKPAKDVPELERTVIEAVFGYGRRKSMSARISGILDGAMDHEIVEIMKHVKPVCK